MIINTQLPPSIIAGDTISWTVYDSDYPATQGWALTYTLISATDRYAVTSTPAGDSHFLTIPAATSATYTAGVYSWRAAFAKSGYRYTTGMGHVTVQPDPAGAADLRTHVKRVLDAIEATIEGRAAAGDQELTIDGTRLVNMTALELLSLRAHYLAEYRREQQVDRLLSGKNSGRKIVTRFAR